jgi:hypothetical protein
MSVELALVPVIKEFSLKPTDIFLSPRGDALNEYGIGCQAIILHQKAIAEAELNKWSAGIIQGLSGEISGLRIKHKIPETALVALKSQFDAAVNMQYQEMEQRVKRQFGRMTSFNGNSR